MSYSISDLRNDFVLSGEFENAPVQRVKYFLLEGFRVLSQKTAAFQEAVQDLTVAGQAEYTLTPATSNTSIFKALRAEFSLIDTPSPSTAVTASGGSLTAATYSYRVSATRNDYGETILSDAVTAVVAASNSLVTISWDAVEGADGYKVYGRTSGAELLMETTTSTSYTDDGTDTPSGAQPTRTELVKEIDVSNVSSSSLSSTQWRASEGDDITGVVYEGENKIRLSQIPITANMGFRVIVALYPTANTVNIPTKMEPYREAIKDYARGALYSLPEKIAKWRDPEMAQFYMGRYVRQEKELKRLILREFGGPIRRPQRILGG